MTILKLFDTPWRIGIARDSLTGLYSTCMFLLARHSNLLICDGEGSTGFSKKALQKSFQRTNMRRGDSAGVIISVIAISLIAATFAWMVSNPESDSPLPSAKKISLQAAPSPLVTPMKVWNNLLM
jgi:hypothetical protein